MLTYSECTVERAVECVDTPGGVFATGRNVRRERTLDRKDDVSMQPEMMF